MRLIDADALYKDICDSINAMTRIGITVDGDYLWAKINDALENASTFELKRETGEWKPYIYVDPDDWYQDKEIRYRCSKCGAEVINKSNFCPNCGTDMKGKRNED